MTTPVVVALAVAASVLVGVLAFGLCRTPWPSPPVDLAVDEYREQVQASIDAAIEAADFDLWNLEMGRADQ